MTQNKAPLTMEDFIVAYRSRKFYIAVKWSGRRPLPQDAEHLREELVKAGFELLPDEEKKERLPATVRHRAILAACALPADMTPEESLATANGCLRGSLEGMVTMAKLTKKVPGNGLARSGQEHSFTFPSA